MKLATIDTFFDECFDTSLLTSENSIFVKMSSLSSENDMEPIPPAVWKAAHIRYFNGRSAKKYASTFTYRAAERDELTATDGKFNSSGIAYLASMLYYTYIDKWHKLYATVMAEYNPIHNYDMEEETVRHLVSAGEKNEVENEIKNLSDEMRRGTSETTNHGRNVEDKSYNYGFNSEGEDGNIANRDETQEGGTTTKTNSGSDLTAMNSMRVDSNAGHEREDVSETINHSRKGNIGVTTSQQMIEQERNVAKFVFIDEMLKDVDSVLTLPIYDPCILFD